MVALEKRVAECDAILMQQSRELDGALEDKAFYKTQHDGLESANRRLDE